MLMSCLAALGVLAAGIVIGIILFAVDRDFLGYIAFLAGLPIALGVWVMMRDRL
jgi:hypothetical protein